MNKSNRKHTCLSKPVKYVSVIRKKSERVKLKATDCIECRNVSALFVIKTINNAYYYIINLVYLFLVL